MMAFYLVSLCNDQKLRNEIIRCGIVNEYLKAIAGLSAPREKLDPIKNAFGQKSASILRLFWMSLKMEENAKWKGASYPKHGVWILPPLFNQRHIDSKNMAFFDWLVLALYSGPNKSEYCQDKVELGKTKTVAKNIDGSRKASTFNNFEFRGIMTLDRVGTINGTTSFF